MVGFVTLASNVCFLGGGQGGDLMTGTRMI